MTRLGIPDWLDCQCMVQEFLMPQTIRAARRRNQTVLGHKDDVIQIRASADTKAILNRAASLRGQALSEFMLDAVRRQAEETLLDQRIFFFDSKAHQQFLALLDKPSLPSDEARKRLICKAPWKD